MKTFEINEAIQILERTPEILEVWLTGLPDSWLNSNEGPDTWSPFDIIGHLIHGEKTDWLTRTRIILEKGVSEPFTPFDRFAQFKDSRGKTVLSLLKEFAKRRKDNLVQLKQLKISGTDLEKTGIHPEFGPVTLKELLAAWVVHDLGHLRQIARVMSKQYKNQIGPWGEYLPVVNE